MGRPRLTDKLKAHTTQKKAIRNASKETLEKVRRVCKIYETSPNQGVRDACKQVGISSTYFYKICSKYANCKELANKVGLNIAGDMEIRPAKIKAPKVPKGSDFSIFDLPARKLWDQDQKNAAITKCLDSLKQGVPFAYAVRFAGVTPALLKEWVREEDGLLDVFAEAEAVWVHQFFSCLTQAAQEAAKRGKFGELVMGAERRFPSDWGKVDTIDITTKDERGNSILSLSAKKEDVKQIDNVDEITIEEV